MIGANSGDGEVGITMVGSEPTAEGPSITSEPAPASSASSLTLNQQAVAAVVLVVLAWEVSRHV